jgi:signal transduction histidine kinase
MLFDTPTLLGVMSLVDVFLACLVIVIWWRDDRYAGMKSIRLGMASFAAGSILSALRAVLPPVLAIGSGNALLTVGGAALMNGILLLSGRRMIWRWHGPAIVLLSLAFGYYLVVRPSVPARNALGAAWDAFLCFTTFVALLEGQRRLRQSKPPVILEVFLLEHTLAAIGRGVSVPFIDPAIDYHRPSPILSVTCIELIFFSIAITILVLQLVGDRLRMDLAQSQSHIATAFRVAHDAFAVFDRNHRFLVANSRFYELFPMVRRGTDGREEIGALFGTEPARFGLELGDIDRKSPQTDRIAVFDRIADRADGTWLHVSGKTTDDGDLIICWTDISAFKKAEEIMAGELRHEREVALLQRNFVSMASHQFRTPLTIIDLNAQLLDPRGGSIAPREEAVDRIGRIRRGVARMIALIDTMLSAASADAGRIKVTFVAVNPTALLQEICNRMSDIAGAGRLICKTVDLPPSVMWDPVLIDQVIVNIVSNAVKYSDQNADITLSAEHRNDSVIIEIADHGVGIPAEDVPLVFERFFRASNVENLAGTGIGLWLARHIVELHGGVIAVSSQLGRGSTFTVNLPVHLSGPNTISGCAVADANRI